jgi:hypothetical protein
VKMITHPFCSVEFKNKYKIRPTSTPHPCALWRVQGQSSMWRSVVLKSTPNSVNKSSICCSLSLSILFFGVLDVSVT